MVLATVSLHEPKGNRTVTASIPQIRPDASAGAGASSAVRSTDHTICPTCRHSAVGQSHSACLPATRVPSTLRRNTPRGREHGACLSPLFRGARVYPWWSLTRTIMWMARRAPPRRRTQRLATFVAASAVAAAALLGEAALGASAGADGAVDAAATATAASSPAAATTSAAASSVVTASSGGGVDFSAGGDGKVVKLTDSTFKTKIAQGGVVFVKFFVRCACLKAGCDWRVTVLVDVVACFSFMLWCYPVRVGRHGVPAVLRLVLWTCSRGTRCRHHADVHQPACPINPFLPL